MRAIHLALVTGLVLCENTRLLGDVYQASMAARNVLNLVLFVLAYRLIFMEGPRAGGPDRSDASPRRS